MSRKVFRVFDHERVATNSWYAWGVFSRVALKVCMLSSTRKT